MRGYVKTAMNTIPTIFNEKITAYTAIGKRGSVSESGISAIVLNRPGISRKPFFKELEKSGFDNVISIETPSPHYDIEDLSERFPFIRFLLPKKEISIGEQINLAVSEIENPLFYVFRSDLKLIAGGTAKRMSERLSLNGETNGVIPDFKRLCTIPVIINSHYEPLPTLRVPVTRKRKIRTAIMEPHIEGQLSLFPFDGIGIYDKKRFVELGGFDTTLKNTYWQLLDFGFRAYLWGEEIALSLQLKLLYEEDISTEDYVIDESYWRFFLKNLAPKFYGDYADLPLYRFLPFLFKSKEDILYAWNEFRKSRSWIRQNKSRWKCDGHGVISRWNAGV